MSEQRETGVVKWFNAAKGYGFIVRDQGGEVFVHFKSIEGSGMRTLQEGAKVEFIVSQGQKGLEAKDVTAK